MVIINNVRNNHLHLHNNQTEAAPIPQAPLAEWQEKLFELMRYVVTHVPIKDLNRQMRSFFLLYVAELKKVPEGHEDIVLHIVAMLELMDMAEDEASDI